MKIEIGKYYVTEDGQTVGPMYDYNGHAASYGTIYADVNGDARGFQVKDGVRRFDGWCGNIIAEYHPSPITANRITTHGTWSPRGTKPKTQYVYEVQFDLDANGHPDWSTATVRGK